MSHSVTSLSRSEQWCNACIYSATLYEVPSVLELPLGTSLWEWEHKTVKSHLVTMKINKIGAARTDHSFLSVGRRKQQQATAFFLNREEKQRNATLSHICKYAVFYSASQVFSGYKDIKYGVQISIFRDFHNSWTKHTWVELMAVF